MSEVTTSPATVIDPAAPPVRLDAFASACVAAASATIAIRSGLSGWNFAPQLAEALTDAGYDLTYTIKGRPTIRKGTATIAPARALDELRIMRARSPRTVDGWPTPLTDADTGATIHAGQLPLIGGRSRIIAR